MADELLLVLEGKKKATISVIKEGGDNTEGRVSILGIGWKRKALLRDQDSLLGVYEVFLELIWDKVMLEGEDKSFTEWKEGNERYWKRDGERRGYVFSPETIMCFEVVEVL